MNGCADAPGSFRRASRAFASALSVPRRCRRIPPPDREGRPHSARSLVDPSSRVAPAVAPSSALHPSGLPSKVRAGLRAQPHPRRGRRPRLTASAARADRIRDTDGSWWPTRATTRAPQTLRRNARNNTRRVALVSVDTVWMFFPVLGVVRDPHCRALHIADHLDALERPDRLGRIIVDTHRRPILDRGAQMRGVAGQ